ncbi:sialidase family protein [Streptomyces sp. CT34]|uniref:sialidase family protein n=1 Tax=Streptomyces sp. CT34 TaxID=1553907 RepID=UPI00068FC108|nr:sialidase family protein [Streptomyces sp. CT34]
MSLAVDPNNPAHMVAAWMQVMGSPGAETGTMTLTASSGDGGSTWSPPVPAPGGQVCSGGTLPDVGDPSLSFGPDGRVYLGRNALAGPVFMTTSPPGTWPPQWTPATIVDSHADDSDTVVADPLNPGTAYVTFTNLSTGALMLATTHDSGQTFAVTPIDQPVGESDVLSRMVVLSDGKTLLNVFHRCPLGCQVPSHDLYATRSTNGGASWSTPSKIATVPSAGAKIVDPQNGNEFGSDGAVSSLAAGPNNSAYLAWTTCTLSQINPLDCAQNSPGEVMVASSADSGATWSSPTDVHRPAETFQANVAVAANGAIGLTWYDFTGNSSTNSILPTTRWLARSNDGGKTFSTPHVLGGPFDMRAVHNGMKEVGDYQSLVPAPGGFEAAFTLGCSASAPCQAPDPADIFAAFAGS